MCAAPAVTNTFANDSAADATEVNQNFSDLVQALDGTTPADITVNNVTAQGTLGVTGAGDFASTLEVGGAFTASGTVTGVGAATFDSTVDVAGAMEVAGAFEASSTVAVADTMTVSGALTAAATITVDGASTFNDTATFNSAVAYAGNIDMSGSDLGTASAPTANVTYPNGMIKAWGQIGSAATILGGYNVSAATRTAQGHFTVNFHTAFDDANYAFIATAGPAAPNDQVAVHISALAAGSAGVAVWEQGGSTPDPADYQWHFIALGPS